MQSELHDNWHTYTHYITDYGYYAKNGFSPPEGTATCCFLGFSCCNQPFSLRPLLVAHIKILYRIVEYNTLLYCKLLYSIVQ